MKARKVTETSVEVKQPVKEGQNPVLGWVCKSRENRVLAPIGEHT